MTPDGLPALWRLRAQEIERFAPAAAEAFRAAAEEYEQAARAAGDELLTLTAAAALGQYSADHLGRLVRQGVIPNAGRPRAPKIRRADVPLKPGTQVADTVVPLDVHRAMREATRRHRRRS